MRQRQTGFVALSLCLLLALPLFLLSACNSDSTGKVFRYDIAEEVDNLDPQFAASNTARMVLLNLYEGLLVHAPDGELMPGVAESYSISDDRLTYTFQLRADARWTSGDAVTAEDFLFSFVRMFRDGSPFAGQYSAIENAHAILAGEMDISSLGVEAQGDHTLIFHLDYPEPLFLQRLTDPAAVPCNEKAFTDARGRYGLDQANVCSNGPFQLRTWEPAKLFLRASDSYRSEKPTVAGGVNFYSGREAADLFLSGKTDLALLTSEQRDANGAKKAEIHPIERTVWCVVFNQNHPVWGNPLLRQGLAHAVDHTEMAEEVPDSFLGTSLLVPGAMRVMGKPYRELTSVASPVTFDTVQAARLFEMGLDVQGLDTLPASATIDIPEQAKASLNMGQLQQEWQKTIAAYINFEVSSPAQIQKKLREGDYQMLLMPITPADSDLSTLLTAFSSGSDQNYFGYSSPLYDELLAAAAEQPTPELAAAKYAQAETLLLSDAVLIPLYFETTYLAISDGVSDLLVSPFGDQIYFKYAQKSS